MIAIIILDHLYESSTFLNCDQSSIDKEYFSGKKLEHGVTVCD